MKHKKQSVFGFFREEIERLKSLQRDRASESCQTTLNSLMRFRRNVDFSFDMLDGDMMERYAAYLKGRGAVRNTVGYYLRCVRSVYNRAVEKGLTIDRQPFRHVYTSKDKTIKRALHIDDVRALRTLDLSASPALDFARDMFLFSFCTRGMSFVDMAFLRKGDVRNDRLCYRRKKTGQLLEMEWMACMQAIVDKYSADSNRYLLPIITDEGRSERRQYQNCLRNINRNLKKVAALLQLTVPLSSYYARHSWASFARNMNVPLSVISEAMGHDSESTTLIYLNSIKSSAVDKANRKILGKI